MSTGNRVRLALAIAAVGLLLSLALRWETARHVISGEASHCVLSETIDCDKVQASSYSRALGLPLSGWGAAGFLLLVLGLFHARGAGGPGLAICGLFAAGGAVLSLVLAYVSWFVIGALCLYCTAMQVCLLGIFVLIAGPAWRARREPGRGAAAFRAALAAACVVALAFAGERAVAGRVELLRLVGQPEIAAMRLDVSDALVLGNPDTPHSVVVFIDFGCPFCKECYKLATRLVKRYPESIHFLFKHWPLDRECNPGPSRTIHPGGCIAARAAIVAGERGKAEEALAYLFERQEFFPQIIAELGRRVGLPEPEWRALMESGEVRSVLARDVDDGLKLHFNSVPQVFLNGHPVDSARLAQRVERLVGQ